MDAGDSARVIVSPSQGEAVFVGQNLPAVDADHVLQLWVLEDGARSVGLIEGSKPLLATASGPDAKLGVTVEPAGGSKQPTTSPVLTVDLARLSRRGQAAARRLTLLMRACRAGRGAAPAGQR